MLSTQLSTQISFCELFLLFRCSSVLSGQTGLVGRLWDEALEGLEELRGQLAENIMLPRLGKSGW